MYMTPYLHDCTRHYSIMSHNQEKRLWERGRCPIGFFLALFNAIPIRTISEILFNLFIEVMYTTCINWTAKWKKFFTIQ